METYPDEMIHEFRAMFDKHVYCIVADVNKVHDAEKALSIASCYGFILCTNAHDKWPDLNGKELRELAHATVHP